MNLLHARSVLVRRLSVVRGLEDSSVDQFAPILTHFFFVDEPQILANELWIDGEHLDVLVPLAKNVGRDDVDIVDQLVRELIRVAGAGSANRQRHERLCPLV